MYRSHDTARVAPVSGTVASIVAAALIAHAPVAYADLGSGLVVHYTFDGNADDASGNGNDGTVDGAVLAEDRCGHENTAYAFDGQNDRITAPSNVTLDITDAITVAAWVRPAEQKSQWLVLKGSLIPAPWSLALAGTGVATFSLNPDDVVTQAVGDPYPLGAWTLVVGTWDGMTIRLYQDGLLTDEVAATGTLPTNPSPLILGTRLQLASDTLNGVLDEVRIWNRALTEDEVLELQRTLVASYPFMGNADDASGNDNDGIVDGAVLTMDRFGVPDRAYAFDGQNDMISVPHSSELDADGAITVSAWIRPIETKTQFVVRKGVVIDAPFDLALTLTGDVRFELALESGKAVATTSSYAIDEWTHLAATWDCTTLTLYENGDPVASTPASGPLTTTDEPVLIGSRLQLPANSFHGDIDEVTIWDGALSESEVEDLMGDGPTPIEAVSWGDVKARFDR